MVSIAVALLVEQLDERGADEETPGHEDERGLLRSGVEGLR